MSGGARVRGFTAQIAGTRTAQQVVDLLRNKDASPLAVAKVLGGTAGPEVMATLNTDVLTALQAALQFRVSDDQPANIVDAAGPLLATVTEALEAGPAVSDPILEFDSASTSEVVAGGLCEVAIICIQGDLKNYVPGTATKGVGKNVRVRDVSFVSKDWKEVRFVLSIPVGSAGQSFSLRFVNKEDLPADTQTVDGLVQRISDRFFAKQTLSIVSLPEASQRLIDKALPDRALTEADTQRTPELAQNLTNLLADKQAMAYLRGQGLTEQQLEAVRAYVSLELTGESHMGGTADIDLALSAIDLLNRLYDKNPVLGNPPVAVVTVLNKPVEYSLDNPGHILSPIRLRARQLLYKWANVENGSTRANEYAFGQIGAEIDALLSTRPAKDDPFITGFHLQSIEDILAATAEGRPLTFYTQLTKKRDELEARAAEYREIIEEADRVDPRVKGIGDTVFSTTTTEVMYRVEAYEVANHDESVTEYLKTRATTAEEWALFLQPFVYITHDEVLEKPALRGDEGRIEMVIDRATTLLNSVVTEPTEAMVTTLCSAARTSAVGERENFNDPLWHRRTSIRNLLYKWFSANPTGHLEIEAVLAAELRELEQLFGQDIGEFSDEILEIFGMAIFRAQHLVGQSFSQLTEVDLAALALLIQKAEQALEQAARQSEIEALRAELAELQAQRATPADVTGLRETLSTTRAGLESATTAMGGQLDQLRSTQAEISRLEAENRELEGDLAAAQAVPAPARALVLPVDVDDARMRAVAAQVRGLIRANPDQQRQNSFERRGKKANALEEIQIDIMIIANELRQAQAKAEELREELARELGNIDEMAENKVEADLAAEKQAQLKGFRGADRTRKENTFDTRIAGVLKPKIEQAVANTFEEVRASTQTEYQQQIKIQEAREIEAREGLQRVELLQVRLANDLEALDRSIHHLERSHEQAITLLDESGLVQSAQKVRDWTARVRQLRQAEQALSGLLG
ncbi:MAG: hypothetical protein ABH823_05065 [bacterium]